MTLFGSNKINITKYLPILVSVLLITIPLGWFFIRNLIGREISVSYPLDKLIVYDDSLSINVSSNARVEDIFEPDIVLMLQQEIEKDINKEDYKEPDNYTFNDKGGCDEYWYPEYRLDECIYSDGSGIYRTFYPYNTALLNLVTFDLEVDLSDIIVSENYSGTI